MGMKVLCTIRKINLFKTAAFLDRWTFLLVTACKLVEHLSPGLLPCQIYRLSCITFHPESALYETKVKKHTAKCNTLSLENEHAVQIHALRICKAPWVYEQVWKMLRQSGKHILDQLLLYYLGNSKTIYPQKAVYNTDF